MIDFDRAFRERQFEVHYQPIIDLDSGEIVTIEARVRWQDRRTGVRLSARDVVAAASKAEAQWMLDHAVLERVKEALELPRNQTQINMPVAVKISAATCATNEATARFEDFLTKTGISSECLIIEFPQDALFSYPAMASSLGERLSAKGYPILVDHVDTDDLDRIPLQSIKLSEKLVDLAPGDTASADQVEAICTAAKKRGLYVGAEGIVRLEQLEFLRRVGVHEGQGPLICRPRPLRDLLFLLQKGRCW